MEWQIGIPKAADFLACAVRSVLAVDRAMEQLGITLVGREGQAFTGLGTPLCNHQGGLSDK